MSYTNRRKVILIFFITVLISFSLINLSSSYGISDANIFSNNIEDQNQKNYDIVIIGIDALRADHLPCYGYERNTASNICNKKNEPIIFKNTYSQAPWTLPSFTSMMSGKWPFNHQTQSFRKIPDNITLIQQNLTYAQYETTGYIDKGALKPYSNFNKGFRNYRDIAADEESIGNNRELFNRGFNFLNNTNHKTFLFLHSMEVHHPYRPKNFTIFQEYAPKNLNSTINITESRLNTPRKWRKENLTEKELEYVKAGYDTTIKQTDQEIGRFINKLNQTGQLENTIVIVTSDHGESFQEHIQWVGHTEHLYNEFIKVPLVIYHPDIQGKTINTRVRLIDIAPTIADFANLSTDKFEFDGKSLMPLMEEETLIFKIRKKLFSQVSDNKKDRMVYSSTYGSNGKRFDRKTLIKDDWKLIWDRDAGIRELYNLEEDPEERNDLAYERKDKVEELSRKLLEMRNPKKKKDEGEEVSESIKERLRKLGYRP